MVGPTIRIFSASDIGLTAQASERDFWQSDAAKKIYCDIVWKIILNPKKKANQLKRITKKTTQPRFFWGKRKCISTFPLSSQGQLCWSLKRRSKNLYWWSKDAAATLRMKRNIIIITFGHKGSFFSVEFWNGQKHLNVWLFTGCSFSPPSLKHCKMWS